MGELAQYLHNLGNLEAQRGRFAKAILRMSQAENFARGIEYCEGTGGREELLSAILVHGAQYRARRGLAADRVAALQCSRRRSTSVIRRGYTGLSSGGPRS